MIRTILALVWAMCATPLLAATCTDVTHDGNRYSYCQVDLSTETLRLFLYDAEGAPFAHFNRINSALKTDGQTLGMAMNAGMYHDDRRPVGHYVENGTELMRVVPNAGPGNFGLLPNGVLCLRDGRADVIETLRFVREAPACTHATQSGPMLVIDGALHPRFLPDSTSRFIRNGVGTSEDGQQAVFAISNNAVTFHEFGSFFREYLKLDQALYFDGNVSRLYAPSLGRNDPGRRLGPIVGTVVPLAQ